MFSIVGIVTIGIVAIVIFNSLNNRVDKLNQIAPTDVLTKKNKSIHLIDSTFNHQYLLKQESISKKSKSLETIKQFEQSKNKRTEEDKTEPIIVHKTIIQHDTVVKKIPIVDEK